MTYIIISNSNDAFFEMQVHDDGFQFRQEVCLVNEGRPALQHLVIQNGRQAPRGADRATRVKAWNIRNWVVVTHETKDAVMRHISPADLRAIDCDNPDIFVRSRRDDRIVIVPSQTQRRNNANRASRKITDVKASEIFGDGWERRLNIMKFSTAMAFIENIPAIDKLFLNEEISRVEFFWLIEILVNTGRVYILQLNRGFPRISVNIR